MTSGLVKDVDVAAELMVAVASIFLAPAANASASMFVYVPARL